MEKEISTDEVSQLWEKMKSRAALAAHLGVAENTVRRWEKDVSTLNSGGYKFEVQRLLKKHGIN